MKLSTRAGEWTTKLTLPRPCLLCSLDLLIGRYHATVSITSLSCFASCGVFRGVSAGANELGRCVSEVEATVTADKSGLPLVESQLAGRVSRLRPSTARDRMQGLGSSGGSRNLTDALIPGITAPDSSRM